MADGWLPIDSAPKDGTHILVGEYGKDPGFHAVQVLFWDENWLAFPGLKEKIYPTHWQHLPPPPQSTAAQPVGAEHG